MLLISKNPVGTFVPTEKSPQAMMRGCAWTTPIDNAISTTQAAHLQSFIMEWLIALTNFGENFQRRLTLQKTETISSALPYQDGVRIRRSRTLPHSELSWLCPV